jgi:hypothetical protein
MIKYALLLGILLLCTSAHAVITQTTLDDFSVNNNCNGNLFSCGTNADYIAAVNGGFNTTIATDDGLATYFCMTNITGVNSPTTSCLIRGGFNATICDIFPEIQAANHSEFYNCSSNMVGCGWNGRNASVLGTPTPTRNYQINTALTSTTNIIFISYYCNTTPVAVQSANTFYSVANIKGLGCSGNNYLSYVYPSGIALSSLASCSAGAFCDPGLLQNYSMSLNISATPCTPGCHDNLQDGSETSIDYGGAICGNCSALGVQHDEFYRLAVELQENNQSTLSGANPFNAAQYCTQGKDTGSSAIAIVFLLLLISGIVVLLLTLVSAILIAIIALGIISFLKRKRERKA